jgi:Integrase core domain
VVRPLYIAPGSPWENAYVESFNSRVQDEHFHCEEFASLIEAQVLAAGWRRDYNEARSHSHAFRPSSVVRTKSGRNSKETRRTTLVRK